MNYVNFETLGRVFSRESMRALSHRIHSAGLLVSPESFAGYIVATVSTISLFITAVLFLLPSTQKTLVSVVDGALASFMLPAVAVKAIAILFFLALIFLIVSFVCYVIVSSVLITLSDARKNAVEAVLPDFLTLIVANVRAGMTLDQAIWYAAKPEFGLLSVEVKNIIKGTFSGESISSALDRLNERFDSRVLARTVALIKQASVTGGEVAKILEMTASDARETESLRKEIAASLIIYQIFILFSSMLGAPFLFAVVNKLLAVIEKSFAFLPQTAVQMTSFIRPSPSLITSADFALFSLAVIFVTSLISAFIISIVQSGSKNQGLKYFPFILIAAYVVYFVASAMLESFFAGMII